MPQFESLAAALDALAACLELGPSAVELMDRMLIDLARNQRSLKDTMAAIRGRPEALLMVEFSSDDPTDVSYRVHELQRRLSGVAGLTASVPALDPATRDPLWSLRSSAVPLLYGMPGDAQAGHVRARTAAVAPERLPEFAARFREIFHRHGTDGAFYGHASVGCLHIRPVLNLHDPVDVRPDADDHGGRDRPRAGVQRQSERRARRRAGAQRVEPEDVRPGGVRGVPPGEARRSTRGTC